MRQDEVEKMLFVSTSDQYGDKYVEHLLEQYKIYLDSAEKISDRRQKANEFFLAVNTALIALLGFIVANSGPTAVRLLVAVSSAGGITMCYFWYRIILSYKGLNSGKFKVVHAIEKRLPLALYDTEWEMLGRGKNKKIYWPFTHIEWCVPWIFIAIYATLLIVVIL